MVNDLTTRGRGVEDTRDFTDKYDAMLRELNRLRMYMDEVAGEMRIAQEKTRKRELPRRPAGLRLVGHPCLHPQTIDQILAPDVVFKRME